MMAREIIRTTAKATMRTISTVVLPEEEGAEEGLELAKEVVELAREEVKLLEENVKLVGDVAAGPVGSEELPALPRTGVVLVGTVWKDRVAKSDSNAGDVKADSAHASSTVSPPSKVYLAGEGVDSGLLVLCLSVRS